jgi:hypothetical protein
MVKDQPDIDTVADISDAGSTWHCDGCRRQHFHHGLAVRLIVGGLDSGVVAVTLAR